MGRTSAGARGGGSTLGMAGTAAVEAAGGGDEESFGQLRAEGSSRAGPGTSGALTPGANLLLATGSLAAAGFGGRLVAGRSWCSP